MFHDASASTSPLVSLFPLMIASSSPSTSAETSSCRMIGIAARIESSEASASTWARTTMPVAVIVRCAVVMLELVYCAGSSPAAAIALYGRKPVVR